MPSSNEFPAVKLSIESGLVSPGDCKAVKDTVAVTTFTMGGRTLEVPDGIGYDVILTNTGDGILVTGVATLSATTQCDRCLGSAQVEVTADISRYYLHEEPQEDVEDEDDFGLIDASDGTVDLSEPIQGGIAMEIPYVILCSEDCKGICPQCGANLNDGDCGCVIVHDPDFDRPNPFAVLSALKFDDAGELEPIDEDDDDDLSDEEFERAWQSRLDDEGYVS